MDTRLFLLIVSVLCGADGFVQIERIARLKEDFLRRHVDLSARIPSHDTRSRFLQLLQPRAFAQAFVHFMACVTARPEHELVSIDGKTLRGVKNKHSEREAHAEDQVHRGRLFRRRVTWCWLTCVRPP